MTFIRLLFLVLVFCQSACAQTVHVSADHKAFLYTGRIDFSDAKAPSLSWPGSSIRAEFSGTSLEVILDDQFGKNFFNIILDGDDFHPYIIETKQGEHSYWISNSLARGAHSVEIHKRTEGEEGRTAFKGLVLDDQGKMLARPERPSRRIEIYGDSVSSGMGNEGAFNGADHLLADKNNYWAYGSIAARELEAELHTISRSGIGIMVSWFGFTMPDFYDQMDAVGDNDTRWDFTRWTPDLVIINLMQNDSWLIDREQKLQPPPDDRARIDAYVNFVRTIRARYPKAPIICALGSMDATANAKWPDYVRRAVAEMRDQGDTKVTTLFFPFNGYTKHPRVMQHRDNAQLLVEFIRDQLGW